MVLYNIKIKFEHRILEIKFEHKIVEIAYENQASILKTIM